MEIITRLLTKNLTKVPILWITFNIQKYKKYGKKNSCMCHIHPCLKDDEYIITTMNELCDYIREKYNMEKIIWEGKFSIAKIMKLSTVIMFHMKGIPVGVDQICIIYNMTVKIYTEYVMLAKKIFIFTMMMLFRKN